MIELIVGVAFITTIIFFLRWLFKPAKKKLSKKYIDLNNALQRAHDSNNYAEVIRLMEGKELTNASLCYVLGNALISTTQKEKGSAVFKKAFTFGDKNKTRKLFGFSLHNNGHHSEAISMLQEIEKDWLASEFKYDDGYDIIETLALSFIKKGDYTLAIETLRSAPLSKRNISDGLNSLFILLAECYEHQGDSKNAMKWYTKSLTYKYNDDLKKKTETLKIPK